MRGAATAGFNAKTMVMAAYRTAIYYGFDRPQSTNSWAAIADACSKTRTLQRLSFKECAFRDGKLTSHSHPACMACMAQGFRLS